MGRLIILAGPSCVGKGPLYAAVRKFYPGIAARLTPLVLFNSRAPRPGEMEGVDYYFRPREEIEALRQREGYVVMDVRGDLQALHLEQLDRALKKGDAFFEGNAFVGKALTRCALPPGIGRLSIFLSPLSRDEIAYLTAPEQKVALPDFLTDVMRRKLLRRTQRQKGILSLKDLENIEKRAMSAYRELQDAPAFDYVLPNHDGEDSEHWDAFYYPIGDARHTLRAFIDLIDGRIPALAERWEEGMVP